MSKLETEACLAVFVGILPVQFAGLYAELPADPPGVLVSNRDDP